MTRNVIQNAGQSYNGVRATTPPQLEQVARDPNTHDIRFIRGTLWLNTVSRDLWRLAGFDNQSGTLLADWVLLGGGTGDVSILHTDDGRDVTQTAGVINITGAGLLSTTGTVGPNTVTLHLNDTGIAQSFPTDSGTATPVAGVLNVLGGTAGRDINTSGAGNTIHVDLNNAITLGDLSAIAVGSPGLSMTTGDIEFFGSVLSAATNQKIRFPSNGDPNIISFLFNNVFIGSGAGNDTMTAGAAIFNIGIGISALHSLTTGQRNVCIGNASLGVGTTASENTFLGYTTGAAITTGSGNIFIGHEAGMDVTTGSNNIIIDSVPAASITLADSNNIFFGGNGAAGENNTLRIGDATGAGAHQLNRSFIHGIRGITTGVNDAIAVLIDSAGQLGTVSSSIRYKKNVEDMGVMSEDIYRLRPVSFDYKNSSSDFKSVGLIAEEVKDVMPCLVVYDPESGQPETIKYHDLLPLLLNEVIKLNKRVQQLEGK